VSETVNNRTLNADVLLFSDEALKHLGGIKTHRATIRVVTKSSSFIYYSS